VSDQSRGGDSEVFRVYYVLGTVHSVRSWTVVDEGPEVADRMNVG